MIATLGYLLINSCTYPVHNTASAPNHPLHSLVENASAFIEAQGEKAIVALLADDDDYIQLMAAGVVWTLASYECTIPYFNPPKYSFFNSPFPPPPKALFQDAIRQAGGIPPLIKLLNSANRNVQWQSSNNNSYAFSLTNPFPYAAGAIRTLATNNGLCSRPLNTLFLQADNTIQQKTLVCVLWRGQLTRCWRS